MRAGAASLPPAEYKARGSNLASSFVRRLRYSSWRIAKDFTPAIFSVVSPFEIRSMDRLIHHLSVSGDEPETGF